MTTIFRRSALGSMSALFALVLMMMAAPQRGESVTEFGGHPAGVASVAAPDAGTVSRTADAGIVAVPAERIAAPERPGSGPRRTASARVLTTQDVFRHTASRAPPSTVA